ncbi:transporter [Sphingomonas jatrophae]|uniref:Putative MetA-pathway of phenol degradation n=1 Tax=Sphingomonas jatrophae TaxID=1166337 RepID=A0A1I6L1L9_9SPHN|nr:transporter [Sphingomonas jatrophae]SFR97332.1 Putative MetA-pathway of phenol degradation [Sphingomonas jatrophae]
MGIALLALAAQISLRDYCPERPGLDTPACIVDRGHVSVETGLVDWTRDGGTNSWTLGDTLVRVGVTDGSEVQLGWTPLGIEEGQARVGDVFVGLKTSLVHADGEGFAVALNPFATLPVGRQPAGAGDWGGGVRVAASFALSEGIKLDLTPEIDAAVDEDGDGRHLAYGSAGGIEFALSDAVTLAVEAAVLRDRDPGGHVTQTFGSGALAWGVSDDLQLDAGAVAGLNHNSPDIELYMGISRRF